MYSQDLFCTLYVPTSWCMLMTSLRLKKLTTPEWPDKVDTRKYLLCVQPSPCWLRHSNDYNHPNKHFQQLNLFCTWATSIYSHWSLLFTVIEVFHLRSLKSSIYSHWSFSLLKKKYFSLCKTDHYSSFALKWWVRSQKILNSSKGIFQQIYWPTSQSIIH